jgi:hypothetical protein
MKSSSMLVAAGVGGLIMLALTKIPLISCLNCLFCIGIWGSGILTVWFYRQMEKDQPGLDIGQGILLGILAGVAAAVLASVVGAVFSGANTLASLDQLRNVNGVSERFPFLSGYYFQRATLFSGSLIGGLLCNLILYPLFGAIGGAIATGIIWKKK